MDMISICITTSDMAGLNREFVSRLVCSVDLQDYRDYEIIISDDSTDDKIREYCWVAGISYYRNPRPGKSSINMNHAVSKAKGDIIKPMFCDDYFIYPDTLSKFVDVLETNQWAF